MLYVYLPNHPNETGCVKHTADDSSGVLYDIGHDDTVIGIEVMLAGPLEVFSGDNAVTYTGNIIDTLRRAGLQPDTSSPVATPRSPFGA